MQTIPIQPLPNQQFTIVLDNSFFDIAIHTTNGVMSVSIAINNMPVIENLRAVAGMRLIPSQYEEMGNFRFSTQNNALPDYAQFGLTQTLLYFSAEELAELRTPVTPPIKASNFNPFVSLPLRFSPQGYIAG